MLVCGDADTLQYTEGKGLVAKLKQFKESGGYTCVEMRHWFERKTGVLAFNVIIEWSQLIIVMR